MEGYCYRSDGHAISRHISDRVWNIFKRIETEANSMRKLPDGVQSYAAYIQKRFYEDDEVQKFDIRDKEDVDAAFNSSMNYLNFHMGGYPQDILALWSDKYVVTKGGIPGGNVKVPPGNKINNFNAVIYINICFE